MSVVEDFLVAFVAVHGEPSLRTAVVAALPYWSRSKGSLLETIRDCGELSRESIGDLEATVRTRLAHFEGDALRAFEGLFRSLFYRENLERSRQFFLALTGGESDRPRPGLVVNPPSRFRREKIHATGGLGQVWLAQDPLLERRVALKEMRPELKNRPEYVRRFVREAKIAGRLQHPNIVTVLEYNRNEGDENPCPFYAMRFVEGTTLSEELRSFHAERKAGRFNRLHFSRLLDAFTDICRAIAYAHSHGILHRDLKPDNVMLGEFGEVVVLDWGLAKEIRRDDTILTDSDAAEDDEIEQTRAGQAIGTPGYMAPEQATGRKEAYSERTDVYGLGGILFTILSGETPHERHPGENLNAMLQRIAEEPTRNVRDVEPRASKTLSAICARAMARNPDSRYSSAADLAADIERWEAGEPIPGFRESPWQRAARWIIRRQRTVTAIGGVLLIAFLAFVISRATASANLTVHVEQQLHDSRDAALSLSQDLLRAAERITAETRFLGELGSVIQLIEAQRARDPAGAERAKLRVEQGLSAFVRRRRNAVRVALVSLVDKPMELVAFRRDQERAINDLSKEYSFANSAQRAAGSFQQMGSDLVYLDGIEPFVDPQRPPRQVWPRIRIVAPVAIANPELGGAIVLEVAYGLFNPILAPEIEEAKQELELDWFLTNDRGVVLWSDPGRYSKLSELRAGASILNLIPELSPIFGATAEEEIRIADARTIESVVYARPLQADYFFPPARFTIIAATPRSHLVEVAAQQQSTVVYAAIGVIVLGVGGGLLSIGILSGIARQSNRGYD